MLTSKEGQVLLGISQLDCLSNPQQWPDLTMFGAIEAEKRKGGILPAAFSPRPPILIALTSWYLRKFDAIALRPPLTRRPD